jgi:GT2 family glycosyltransferase
LLERCLTGVLAQEPGAEEIVVVARPEDDEARAIVQRASLDAPIRWVKVTEPGHVPPVRAGVEAAATDLVAFLDDDAVPEAGWLASLVGVMRDPSVVCVGGYVWTEGTRPIVHPDAGTLRWYGKYVGNVGALETSRPTDVDAVMEGNSCWRTNVIRSLEFHPVLACDDASMYGLDLCLQAKERGGRVVYTSAARVVHTPGPRHGSKSREDRRSSYRSYGRNYTLIALRHLHGWRRPVFVAWWWLVGERASYGVATAVIDLLVGRVEVPLVLASFRAKTEGVRVWLSSRQAS